MWCHIAQVGTMSSVASFSRRPGMIEREPVGDAAAAIMAGEAKADMTDGLHHLDHGLGHRALGVGRILGISLRRVRPAVAGQVRDDEAVVLRQRRRHAMPHHIRLRIAVQQQQRRPLPAGAREDAAGGCADPFGGEAGIEIGEIGHAGAHCVCDDSGNDVSMEEVVAPEQRGKITVFFSVQDVPKEPARTPKATSV